MKEYKELFGKYYKECDVHLLPTNDYFYSTFLLGVTNDTIILTQEASDDPEWERFGRPHQLYITSDEEIIDGDWFIMNGCLIRQCVDVRNPNYSERMIIDKNGGSHSESVCQKIIATTDQSLHIPIVVEPGLEEFEVYNYRILPRPDDKYLERFRYEYKTNNPHKKVLVEYGTNNVNNQEVMMSMERKKLFFEDIVNGQLTTVYLELSLIVDNDNNITIKKPKTSYTPEEVAEILKVARLVSTTSTLGEYELWSKNLLL